MRHFPIYQEPQGDMMIVQVLQVLARKYGLHFFRQFFGVIASHAEGNDSPDVPKNGVLDTFGQLVEVLMGEVKVQAVFTSFREDGRENVGGKILKFVNIKEKIFSF
ncbi:MAG: hypothetical protein UV57_C0032G0001, partial [Parcubacteria group bacterium GW2011_GWD2_43_10]